MTHNTAWLAKQGSGYGSDFHASPCLHEDYGDGRGSLIPRASRIDPHLPDKRRGQSLDEVLFHVKLDLRDMNVSRIKAQKHVANSGKWWLALFRSHPKQLGGATWMPKLIPAVPRGPRSIHTCHARRRPAV